MWFICIVIAILMGAIMPDVPPQRADAGKTAINPSGVSGRTLPDVRQGVSRFKEVTLVTLYEDAAKQINIAAGKAIADLGVKRSADFRLARAAVLRSQIDDQIRRLSVSGRKLVAPIARESYLMGLRQAIAQMRKIGISDATRSASSRGALAFTSIDNGAVDLVAQDIVGRLTASMQDHADRAATVFRSLSKDLTSIEPDVNRAIARGIITGNPRLADRSARELFRDRTSPQRESVRKLGAKQIEVGKWTGKVRDYVDIVVRTRTREATIKARHTRLLANDLDLVQITGRVSINFCTRYIGLIVALGDARDGYPSINELPSAGPPFHPRCSKGTAMFHPTLSSAARSAANARALPAFRLAQSSGNLTKDLG